MGILTSSFVLANVAQPSAAIAGTVKPVPIAATPSTYIPKWTPATAYALGQQVISANNDVVAAKAAHTSSAAFATDTAKWTLSCTYDRKTRLTVHPAAGQADFQTLAAAAAVAVAGDEILLQAGDHALTAATIPAGVTLSAAKVGARIVGADNTSGLANYITLNTGCRVRGVKIENTGLSGGGVAFYTAYGSTDIALSDCHVKGTFQQGVLLSTMTNGRVTGCHFEGLSLTTGTSPGDGINIYGVDGATITGNTFTNCRQDACYVNASSRNVTFSGNVVRGGSEGVQVRVGCEAVTITGNTFDITGSSVISSFGVIVQTNSPDCVVSNNTFRTTAGTAPPYIAIRVDSTSHRTVISGNTIKGVWNKGIVVQTSGAAGNESTDCVITGNSITAPTTYSIQVAPGENGTIVTGNTIRGGGDKAILISADRCTVTGNKVRGNVGYDGITIGGAFNAVAGNHVSDVGANAGILISGTNNAVTGNTCTNNRTYGINDTGDRNIITGNIVTGNLNATADIASTGGASKIAYNLGRYTQKGAA